jgi:predicted nucleic acid-binding Zn ribbon protein
MKDVEDIGSVIDSVVEKMGINRKLNTSNIFNHWEDIAGKEIAKRSRPQKFVRKTLYVSVTSSTWANELSLMSEELIKKINSFAGEEVVKTVRFKADL